MDKADSVPLDNDRDTVSFGSSAGARAGVDVPEPGTVVDGKYRVERVLGAGGMGVVVSALHLELGERVALKFLAARADRAAATRFRREARVAVRLKSEHIVHLMDVGTLPSGAPYLVMELLEGASVARVLEERGPLAIDEAVAMVLQAMVAIAEAHRHGIVHRDIKPSNMFVTERADGSMLLKVIDFGIAKLLDAAASPDTGDAGSTTLTQATVVLGSPSYMAPEQIRNARDVDARTDVWSLGVVLHELVSRRLPFEADTQSGVMAAVVADPPAPLRAHVPEAPAELERIILRCLEKERAERYSDVAELAAALSPLAEGPGQLAADRVRGTLAAPASEITAQPAVSHALGDGRATASAWQLSGAAGAKPRARRLAVAAVGLAAAAAIAWRAAPGDGSTAATLEASLPTKVSDALVRAERKALPSHATSAAEAADPSAAAPMAPASSTSARAPRDPAPRSPKRTIAARPIPKTGSSAAPAPSSSAHDLDAATESRH